MDRSTALTIGIVTGLAVGIPIGMISADWDYDGFTNTVDKCPYDPETFNGVDDLDGCPDSNPNIELSGTNSDDMTVP